MKGFKFFLEIYFDFFKDISNNTIIYWKEERGRERVRGKARGRRWGGKERVLEREGDEDWNWDLT